MKAVYNYNDSGFFTNISEARLDNLETIAQMKAVYLLPRNATFIQPPSHSMKHYVKWLGTKWKVYEFTWKELIQLKLGTLKQRIKRLWN